MTNYKSLQAWKKSMLLVKTIYLLCKNYPKEELYSLTSQTKRACVSVPANIAEGHGRRSAKDSLQFLYISRGSLYEVETLVNIAVMIGFLEEEKYESISKETDECLRLLNGLINHFEKKLL